MISYDGRIAPDDAAAIHALLSDTYWARGRSAETVARSLERSVTVVAREGGRLVGLARAVTDGATFAWICDVVVEEGLRGRGVGRELMARLLAHAEIAPTRKLLVTRDAQEFYAELGFATHPFECMVAGGAS